MLGFLVSLFANTITYEKAPEPTTDDYISQYAREYEVDEELARAIMWCESRMKHNAYNVNKDGTEDFSYWQINNHWHEEKAREEGFDIENPIDNLEYGFILLSRHGTKLWTASEKCWSHRRG